MFIAPQHVNNSKMGISDKELNALAEIVDELAIDPGAPRLDHGTDSMLVSTMAHTVVDPFPPNDGSKVDSVDATAHSHKRSLHGKHHSSSSAKCSRSGTDLADATKDKTMTLEMAEAVEQLFLKH
ncbi:hypothetical protein V6N11_008537 [Hibiscus sabdariffa]|uniref:Uncharacterized protein n=1 Tax=Hibiscus sabdariffa TaxID=183260 RepID=A0ABR2PNX7_9ROSI